MATEGFENFQAVVTSLSAAAAAYVAWAGLSTWKKQQTWQNDHELARRLLIQTYEYRSTFGVIRSPVMFPDEMILDENELQEIPNAWQRITSIRRAYDRRWAIHWKADSMLSATLIESEAVWGPDLKRLYGPIHKLRGELYANILMLLDTLEPNMPSEVIAYRSQELSAQRKLIYEKSDSESDAFQVDFASFLNPIESYLRQKLGRP